jgi:hypothetical protein
MNIAGIIFAQPISTVWQVLGGDPPRCGRARAFYRNGENPGAVSLNDEKGGWYDFVAGQGGGVLDLVQQVRGCTRQAALRWLADLSSVPLDRNPLSRTERRRYARARMRVPGVAQELSDWTRGLYLVAQRDVTATSSLLTWLLEHNTEPGSAHRLAVGRLQGLRAATPREIAAVYVDARRRDSSAVAAIVRLGREDRQHTEQVTWRIVNLLAAAEAAAA